MALDTYANVVTEVQDWLYGRSDIAAKVPTFLSMFEAKANRTLKVRQMEQRATATVDLASQEPEFITLPQFFHSMRRVRMKNVDGKPRLKFATGAQMDDFRESRNNVTGQPIWFTVLGDEIELCPTPNTAVEIEMVYRKYIPALTVSNTTNWLLELAPDLYLYGTLLEAAPYLDEDERIPVWTAGVTSAITQLNELNQEATYNAGPLVVRRKGRSY